MQGGKVLGSLKLDFGRCEGFVKEHELEQILPLAKMANRMIEEKKGPGEEFLGWVDLPVGFDKGEWERIKKAAKKIQSDSEVLVVIGIGGSYLGARAVIEALSHNFKNDLPKEKRGVPKILYAGNSISSTYLKDMIEYLSEVDFSINVISKSGTTTEPAIAFRVLRQLLTEKYGENASKRIYATTDTSKGALRILADTEGYESFIIPDDIGGRYSVLTAVGLLPIATAGIDIDQLMQGAADAREEYRLKEASDNAPILYAAYRNLMLRKGKAIEILVNYEPQLHYLSEWFKQLYGESEGKDGKGLFPASLDFSTDLHSMGQYIQDGRRILFETVLQVKSPLKDLEMGSDEQDLDGLNYLCGKTMNEVNQKAFLGTLMAHYDGGVPNIIVEMARLDAYTMGYLIYFFEKACGISGYMLGVNPFDQPGVEAYKKNMFALLGKSGYEARCQELIQKIDLEQKEI